MSLLTGGMGPGNGLLIQGLRGGPLAIIYRKVLNLISWIGNQL